VSRWNYDIFLQSEMKSHMHTDIKITAINVVYNTSSMLVFLCISDDEFRKICLSKLFIFDNIISSIFLLSAMVLNTDKYSCRR
jgi:hypothetical protein